MQPSTRYAVAMLIGLVAATVAYFAAAAGAVDGTLARLVAGLNFLVWTGFVAHYVPTYAHLDGAPGNCPDDSGVMAVKWGAVAGLAASLGIAGTSLVLLPLLPNWYVAAVGLFVFGLTMWMVTVGMAVVTDRFRHERLTGKGDGPARPESDANSTAADD